jgi:hypothetical protein
LGVTADKVVLSWIDFSGGSFGNCLSASFSGQETWVVDKAAVLNGVPAAMQGFGPDLNRFRLVPVQLLTFSSPAGGAFSQAMATWVWLCFPARRPWATSPDPKRLCRCRRHQSRL